MTYPFQCNFLIVKIEFRPLGSSHIFLFMWRLGISLLYHHWQIFDWRWWTVSFGATVKRFIVWTAGTFCCFGKRSCQVSPFSQCLHLKWFPILCLLQFIHVFVLSIFLRLHLALQPIHALCTVQHFFFQTNPRGRSRINHEVVSGMQNCQNTPWQHPMRLAGLLQAVGFVRRKTRIFSQANFFCQVLCKICELLCKFVAAFKWSWCSRGG